MRWNGKKRLLVHGDGKQFDARKLVSLLVPSLLITIKGTITLFRLTGDII
jgi:hypothetical protein